MSETIKTYKIYRWDPVLFSKSNDPTPIPVICIKPDKGLLDFAKDNNNTFLVEILNTNNIYQDKKIVATFTKSSDAFNFTPNMFKEDGLYALALQCEWYEYPDCNGDCKIYGITGGVKAETVNGIELTTPKEMPEIKEKYTLFRPSSVNNKMNAIYIMSTILIVYFIVSIGNSIGKKM